MRKTQNCRRCAASMRITTKGFIQWRTDKKICSGVGALERALNSYGKTEERDFSARLDVLHQAKELGQRRDG